MARIQRNLLINSMIDENGRDPNIGIMKVLENFHSEWHKLEDLNMQELLDQIVVNFHTQPRRRFKLYNNKTKSFDIY